MGKSAVGEIWDILGLFAHNLHIDDAFDRGQRIYAPLIFMMASSLYGIIHFFRDPIECTKTSMDAQAKMSYVKTYCWAYGTYHPASNSLIDYYQWTPMIFALQALLLQVPHAFWLRRCAGSGINMPAIMKAATELTVVHSNSEKRLKITEELGHNMDAYFKRNITGLGPLKNWKKKTVYNMILAYFATKVLYIGCLIGQIALINSFLDGKFLDHARRFFENPTLNNDALNASSQNLFPILTICNFPNKLNENSEKLDMKQHLCTLPLNMYNGPLFAINCLILCCLILAMIVSIAIWTVRLFLPSIRDNLVQTVLKQNKMTNSQAVITKFVDEYLHSDGILILRLIRINLGVHTSRAIVLELFRRFQEAIELIHAEQNAGQNPEKDSKLPVFLYSLGEANEYEADALPNYGSSVQKFSQRDMELIHRRPSDNLVSSRRDPSAPLVDRSRNDSSSTIRFNDRLLAASPTPGGRRRKIPSTDDFLEYSTSNLGRSTPTSGSRRASPTPSFSRTETPI